MNGTFSLGRLAFNGSRHVRLPKPHCIGSEESILSCKGNTAKNAIQFGGTVCGELSVCGESSVCGELFVVSC